MQTIIDKVALQSSPGLVGHSIHATIDKNFEQNLHVRWSGLENKMQSSNFSNFAMQLLGVYC